MSTEENKARVHRFYEEVFNRKNMAALDEFIDPQAIDHSAPAGAPGGIEGARQFADMFLTAFPDGRFIVENLIAEGDQVVARLTQSGTHQGIFLGIPPNRETRAGHGHRNLPPRRRQDRRALEQL